MLSKKFLSDGETPESAASATWGIIIEVVKATAVNPATAFSFNEALTSNFLPFDADFAAECLTGNGLKKASEVGILF
ncbi:hypothetical protein NAB79_19715 [Proteus mirabilis]|nr:hypothetical protein [Proteus mirabilis]